MIRTHTANVETDDRTDEDKRLSHHTSELTGITLLPTSGGDMARGCIRVTFLIEGTEVCYEVSYGTAVGPDGLSVVPKDHAGDEVLTHVGDDTERRSLPRQAHAAAQATLSVKHHTVRTAKPPQSGVCFAGIERLSDDEVQEVRSHL